MKTETEDEVLISSTGRPSINYQVELTENEIYEESILEEDGIYITSYINNLFSTFSYLIHATGMADIKGSYSVIATLESRVGSAEDGGVLWTKEYELVPPKEFNVNSIEYAATEELEIDYQHFTQISREMKELTEISSNDVLSVAMPISYTVETPFGVIVETATPKLSIPLDQKFFQIERLELEEINSDLTQSITNNIAIDRNYVILLSILILLLAVAIIILRFFTEPYSAKDLYEKSIKKIFREYGQRLVGVKNCIEFKEENNRVKTMEDLIKISDELNKPILYPDRENLLEIKSFYLFDQEVMYTFNVISSDLE